MRRTLEVAPYAVVACSEVRRIDEVGFDDLPVVDPDPRTPREAVCEDMIMMSADRHIGDKHGTLRRYRDPQLFANLAASRKPRVFAPPEEAAGKRPGRE